MSEFVLSEDLFQEFKNKIEQELISEIVESWDNLRDFVLDAPILSNDVYELREYIHKIKEYIKLERKKWEAELK